MGVTMARSRSDRSTAIISRYPQSDNPAWYILSLPLLERIRRAPGTAIELYQWARAGGMRVGLYQEALPWLHTQGLVEGIPGTRPTIFRVVAI